MKRTLLGLVLAALAGCAPSGVPSAGAATRPAATRPVATRPAATATASRPVATAATASDPATTATATTTTTTTTATTATATTRPVTTREATQARLRRVVELSLCFERLAAEGRIAEARPLLEVMLRLDPKNGMVWYNLACVDARTGEPKQALVCLEKALEFGFSDFRHMTRDSDLDSLRKLPGFARVMARNEEIQRVRGERIHEALRRQFGEGYIYEIDHANRLVFATNIDQPTLDELKTHLTAYAEAMWGQLFDHHFEQYVTIVVPKTGQDGIRNPSIGGYYNHAQRVLVCKQIGMVLTHEFTHALHAADQDGLGQQHPIWIMEGLANLFETSDLEGGKVVPRPNHRLNLLKRLAAQKKTVPLKDLCRMGQPAFMKQAVAAYPQVRYFMMYLHESGLLKKWYDAYTEGFEKDKTGAKALEKVLEKPLDEIERDFLAWVERQKDLPTTLMPDQPYVGVRVASQIDGLMVAEVVPGSGAAKAGIKPGDVFVHVDGERIVDQGELILLVSSHKVGDKLIVQYRREGNYYDAAVVLQAVPAPPTRPAPASRLSTASRPTTSTASASATRRATTASRPAATRRAGSATWPATRRTATASRAATTTSRPATASP